VKRTLSLILALSIGASGLMADEPAQPAQSEQAIQSAKTAQPAPQIAFRLLDDYVQHRQERINRTMTRGAIISMVCGGVFLGTAAITFFWGDDISRNVVGEAMTDAERNALSIGFGLGGAAFITSGAFMLSSPARDLRSEYASIFQEEDPVIQEAMAAATLKALSDRAKAKRIGAVALEFSAVGLVAGLKVGANLFSGEPWSADLDTMLSFQSWAFLGILPMFFIRNEEELLNAKDRAAREALYSTTRPKSGEAKGRTFRIEVGTRKRGAALEIYSGPDDEEEAVPADEYEEEGDVPPDGGAGDGQAGGDTPAE